MIETKAMEASLRGLAAMFDDTVRVVDHHYGLPILRFPSGKCALLETSGRLTWIRSESA